MRGFLGVVLGVALAGAATAEPIGGKEARKQVFSLKGAQVDVLDVEGLSDQDRAILEQVGATQFYYAAIAMSPSEGLMSNSLVAAANYHDVENARTVALEGCNERRESESESCVIVAEVRPKDYEPRDLELSFGATEALRKDYRKGKGAKALAVSPSTGKFSVAKEEGAAEIAISTCAELSEAEDCIVVVQD